MQRYNLQLRVEIVTIFYQSKSSILITLSKLKAKFGKTKVPSNPKINSLENAFETLEYIY